MRRVVGAEGDRSKLGYQRILGDVEWRRRELLKRWSAKWAEHEGLYMSKMEGV